MIDTDTTRTPLNRDAIRAERRRRKLRRTLGAVVAALLIVAAGLTVGSIATTAAAFTDFGTLDADYSSRFQLGAIDANGRTVIASGDAVTGSIPASNRFVPGTTANVTMTLFNNSPTMAARLAATPTITSNRMSLLRVSATWTDADGTRTLFGDPGDPRNGVPVAEIPATTDVHLAARGEPSLAPAVPWSGPADSRGTLTVILHMLDDPAAGAYSSGATSANITVSARSS